MVKDTDFPESFLTTPANQDYNLVISSFPFIKPNMSQTTEGEWRQIQQACNVIARNRAFLFAANSQGLCFLDKISTIKDENTFEKILNLAFSKNKQVFDLLRLLWPIKYGQNIDLTYQLMLFLEKLDQLNSIKSLNSDQEFERQMLCIYMPPLFSRIINDRPDELSELYTALKSHTNNLYELFSSIDLNGPRKVCYYYLKTYPNLDFTAALLEVFLDKLLEATVLQNADNLELINLLIVAANNKIAENQDSKANRKVAQSVLRLFFKNFAQIIVNPDLPAAELQKLLANYIDFIAANKDLLGDFQNIFKENFANQKIDRKNSNIEKNIIAVLLCKAPSPDFAVAVLDFLNIKSENKAEFNRDLLNNQNSDQSSETTIPYPCLVDQITFAPPAEFLQKNRSSRKSKQPSPNQELQNKWQNFCHDHQAKPQKPQTPKTSLKPKKASFIAEVEQPTQPILPEPEKARQTPPINPFLSAIQNGDIEKFCAVLSHISNLHETVQDQKNYLQLALDFALQTNQEGRQTIIAALIEKYSTTGNLEILLAVWENFPSDNLAFKNLIVAIFSHNDLTNLQRIFKQNQNLAQQILSYQNSQQDNILQIAIKLKKPEIIGFLLGHIVDFEHKNNQGKTALNLLQDLYKSLPKEDLEKELYWQIIDQILDRTIIKNSSTANLEPQDEQPEFAQDEQADLRQQYLEIIEKLVLFINGDIEIEPATENLQEIYQKLEQDLHSNFADLVLSKIKDIKFSQDLAQEKIALLNQISSTAIDQDAVDYLQDKIRDHSFCQSLRTLQQKQQNLQAKLAVATPEEKQKIEDEISGQRSGLLALFNYQYLPTKQRTVQFLSEQTQDIREILFGLGASKVGASGSAVYYPLLEAFDGLQHFSLRRKPEDIDLFCVLDDEQMKRFTSDLTSGLLADKFSNYQIIPKQISGQEVDFLNYQNTSVSFSLRHKETGQKIDINIYQQQHLERFHQFQFGYDRMELAWNGQNKLAEWSVNNNGAEKGQKENFDRLYWRLSTNEDNCFWQPNQKAKKFLQRLGQGSGCLQVPDIGKQSELQNKMVADMEFLLEKFPRPTKEIILQKYQHLPEEFLSEIYDQALGNLTPKPISRPREFEKTQADSKRSIHHSN